MSKYDAVLNAKSFLDEVCDTFYSGSQDLNSMSLLLCETIDEMICEQTVYDSRKGLNNYGFK